MTIFIRRVQENWHPSSSAAKIACWRNWNICIELQIHMHIKKLAYNNVGAREASHWKHSRKPTSLKTDCSLYNIQAVFQYSHDLTLPILPPEWQ
jgi:hypothetical protein